MFFASLLDFLLFCVILFAEVFMSKLFDFVEQHKLQIAIEFLVLSVITLFLPTLALTETSKIDGSKIGPRYSYFNFYSGVFDFWSLLFTIVQITLLLVIVLLILIKIFNKQNQKLENIDSYLLPVACVCQFIIFAYILCIFVDLIIYTSKLTESEFTYLFIPHVSFFIHILLTIFAICYFIAVIKRHKLH